MITRLQYLVVCIAVVQLVSCDYSALITLHSFSNPSDRRADGAHCDPFWWTGVDLCDMTLKICIEDASSNTSPSNCATQWISTSIQSNSDLDTFGNGQVYGQWTNPNTVAFPGKTWQGLRIKVQVWDDDSGGVFGGQQQPVDNFIYSTSSMMQNSVTYHHQRNAGVPETVFNFDYYINCGPNCHPNTGPTTTPLPTTNGQGYSQGYIHAGQMISSAMNMSADPCNDFYNYACGGWQQSHPIPPFSSSVSNFGLLNNRVLNDTANALSQISYANIADPNYSHALKQAKKVYNACTQGAHDHGTDILAELMILGGYPMYINGWEATGRAPDPATLTGTLQARYGSGSLVSSYPDTDWRNPTQRKLQIDQAATFIPAVYYGLNNSLAYQNAFVNYVIGISLALADYGGITVNSSVLAADVQNMLRLELTLAQISVPQAQLRNFTQQYNSYTYMQLGRTYPNFNWYNYYNSLAGSYIDPAVLFNNTVNVLEPSFLTALNLYMLGTDPAFNRRTLQSYLLFKVMASQASFVPQFRKAYLEFKKVVEDVDDLPPMAFTCTNLIIQTMPEAAGRLYVDYHFNHLSSQTAPELNNMISGVLNAFRNMITNLQWMDSQSKQGAYYKIANLIRNVAYSPGILSNNILDAHYPAQWLNVSSSDNLFFVLLKLSRYDTWITMQQLLMPTDRTAMNGSPATVNAWYQPQLNSITFPAAILNSPFFQAGFPMAVNHGAMGVVMGHELTHGFDDEGVQWDGVGKLNPWIDAQSAQGFRNMAQCVINEYSNFCYPGYPAGDNCVSGVRTQGENIADNGGIKAAYNAYQNWLSANGREMQLPPPLNNFSLEQIFFLSFGQVWCMNVKASSVQTQLLVDPHSPAKFRVLGTLRNSPQFRSAFNCPIGSNMAPANHCTVW